MRNPDDRGRDDSISVEGATRREFLGRSGLALGSAGLAMSMVGASPELATEAASARPAPDEVLASLMEGNKRFVAGKLTHPGRRPEDFLPLADGQSPTTIVVGCADSRVSPELIFDQGVGDLFVVRVAGNIISGTGPSLKGSIEFAVAELGARLIVVLGHEKCGAVQAAIDHLEANDVLPGSIRGLVDLIRPAAAKVRGKEGDKLTNAIEANVLENVERLKGLDPILAPMVKAGELKVVGATYLLRSGEVKLLG